MRPWQFCAISGGNSVHKTYGAELNVGRYAGKRLRRPRGWNRLIDK
jgi:hypothetical protein